MELTKKAFNRRTFLKGSALAGTALGTLALTSGNFESLGVQEAKAQESGKEHIGYTTCNICNQTRKCGLKVTAVDGKVVRVDANKEHVQPVPCLKGYASPQIFYNPNRLLFPVKRTNPEKTVDGDPGWERISWDEALETIATKFNESKEKYGPDSVMFSCGDPKENLAIFNRLGNLFGTASIAYGGAQCQHALVISNLMTFGTVLSQGPKPETKVHMIWGSNDAWSNPNNYKKLLDAKEQGVKFIVIDPRRTPTAVQLADVFLQLRSGTDGALALAMANIMIEEGLYDKEFVEKWTHGFEEFKEYAAQFTPEKAEEITWVPADKIIEAARLWGSEGPGTCYTGGHGTTHHVNGVYNQNAINALITLAGHIDVPGGAVINPNPFPYDTYDSTPGFYLHHLREENKPRRPGIDRWPVWNRFKDHMQNNGLPEYIDDGIIKNALFIGTNVMLFPQTHVYQEAISRLDFAVQIDFAIHPETSNLMDIILPAAMLFERKAPNHCVGGATLYANEIFVEPQGEAREDWQTLLDLGCALGFEEEMFHGDIEAAMQGMLDTDEKNPGITVEDVRQAMPAGYKVERPEWEPKKYESGKLRKDGKPGFNTVTGKIEFVNQALVEEGYDGLPLYNEPLSSPISTPDLYEKYPLVLVTGSRIPQYVHSKYRHTPWMNQFMPDPVVHIHPVDAEKRGLSTGDNVKMYNQYGELLVKADVTNLVREGQVEFHHGWVNANSCVLIPRDFDPLSGFPSYKDGIVEIERVV